jgi:hypothetical protein
MAIVSKNMLSERKWMTKVVAHPLATADALQTIFDLCISKKTYPSLTPQYQLNICKTDL